MKIKLKIQRIPPGGSHIFVESKIDGKKIVCLIDTGASKSVIDSTFIKNNFPLFKTISSEHSTTGLGATYDKSSFVIIPEIQLGEKILRKKKFGLIDLSGVNHAYAQAGLKPIIVIIGGDILLNHKCIIDYRNKILQIK